jgi:hypothetical protein
MPTTLKTSLDTLLAQMVNANRITLEPSKGYILVTTEALHELSQQLLALAFTMLSNFNADGSTSIRKFEPGTAELNPSYKHVDLSSISSDTAGSILAALKNCSPKHLPGYPSPLWHVLQIVPGKQSTVSYRKSQFSFKCTIR